MPRTILPILLLATLFASATDRVFAGDIELVVNGVSEPVLANVEAFVAPFRLASAGRLSNRRLASMRAEAEVNASQALRPYGYYHPVVSVTIVPAGENAWRMQVDIDPGPPVTIATSSVELDGPGAFLPELKDWRRNWPLIAGQTLVQPTWDAEKQRALDIAADAGYLLADFSRHSIELDLERNEARLDLALDTGEQAVMGAVRFDQDVVRPHVVNNLPRFQAGDPYDAWIMERFRVDLWQTGYFQNIEVVEDRHLDESPPRVDLDVHMKPRPPNTYQGTIGVGSDTGARVLFSWDRHLISDRGDSFSLATGWQDHNNELFVRGGYRIPRNVRSRQAWIAEALLKRENEDLLIRNSDEDEVLLNLGNVDITDYSVRVGRLRIRDRRQGFRQWFETWYAQFLYEDIDFAASPDPSDPLSFLRTGGAGSGTDRASKNLSFGAEYEMPYIRGQGFETVGLHYRGWAFVSDSAWGSDNDFGQAYFSARWNGRVGDRWKILARGEVGYSHADVDELEVFFEDQAVSLSVTQLPNLYRFKAGGSTSVRGYGFERLSNNNIGSNNIVTASLEAEYRILDKWSLAAFFDAGNAFNDWGDMKLKKGLGFGVRWYTIAGAMRVDVAKPLDYAEDSWRIHFTIGASVL